MNIRRIRNKLPGVIVRREGKRVTFNSQGREGESTLGYSVPGNANEGETAEMIRSKIPVATIRPKR